MNESFEINSNKILKSGPKSPIPDRTLLFHREIDMADLNSKQEAFSISETMRSSYDLISEAKKHHDKYAGFKNRLIENQKNALLRGRNSMNPFNNTQIIHSENIQNKRQSVRPSHLSREKVYGATAKIIDLN